MEKKNWFNKSVDETVKDMNTNEDLGLSSEEVVQRKSKYGKIFYGCNKYPDCDFVIWNEPTGEKCPECGSLLVKKVLKKGTFEECSSKTCNYSKEIENV